MLVFRLIQQRYPVVVYLRGSFPTLLLGITSRLVAAKFIPGEPVIARYLRPIETLWGPVPKHNPRLYLGDENIRFARSLLFGGDAHEGPRIAIHAAAVTASKMWPVERFAALADDLFRMFGAQVHCFGSQDDKLILHRIFRHSIYSHRFHSTLSLPQVAAAISLCDLFIGNDSGLSHMAAAVGTPIIVLWGPANLNMARPKAPPDRCMILYHDVPCRVFCPEIRCINPIELECVKKIQPDDVLEAAKSFLTKSRRSPARCVS
jgi:ADP-heptose:LPS heptosyltransferase